MLDSLEARELDLPEVDELALPGPGGWRLEAFEMKFAPLYIEAARRRGSKPKPRGTTETGNNGPRFPSDDWCPPVTGRGTWLLTGILTMCVARRTTCRPRDGRQHFCRCRASARFAA
ncbi:hypothetical protein [Streptomyces sp. TRM75561]|uniref:hypothetical protein n=1 Tax=Streptomyces sp. TRM75561 TaxID=2975269 RepID=UPI00244AF3CA|nr:hypothetical protein [Streptomyces sp. TRM75561]MDH3033683.1 hypothetical protein [Streptomyces sp. TRM75561]